MVGCRGETPSDAAITATNLADVCKSNTYFTRAPGASSSPPRPIEVFADVQNGFVRQPIFDRGDEWSAEDPSRTQLAACAKRVGEGDKIKDCPFDTGGPVALHDARYEVTVYEIKTREARKVVEIPAKGDICPTVAFFSSGEDRKLFARPTAEQYVTALRDQVEG